MHLPERITACMGCLKSRGLLRDCPKDADNRCLCPETGRAFYAQATEGVCPLQKFGALPGPLTAWKEPEAVDPEAWRLDSSGNEGCGCKG